jgi:hypothetical protein
VTDADRPMHVRAAAPEPTTGDVDNPAHPDSPSASVPHRGASHREAGFSHADPPELGVAVGVLDTGIAANGDLAGRVVASADLSGEWSFDDAYGHGTFMAGLAAMQLADAARDRWNLKVLNVSLGAPADDPATAPLTEARRPLCRSS